MNKPKKCECRVCQRHQRYAKHMAELHKVASKETAEFFEEIYTSLNNTELDRDVSDAIINGQWPSANENIEAMRADEVIVKRSWVSTKTARDTMRHMIAKWECEQPPGTRLSGDYLDYVLRRVWEMYLESRNKRL